MNYSKKNTNIIYPQNTASKEPDKFLQKMNKKTEELNNKIKEMNNLNSLIKKKKSDKDKEKNANTISKLENEIKNLKKKWNQMRKEKLELETEIKNTQNKTKETKTNKGANTELKEEKKAIKKARPINDKNSKFEDSGTKRKSKIEKNEILIKTKDSDRSPNNNNLIDKHDNSQKDIKKITESKDNNSNLVKSINNNSIELNNKLEDKKMGGNSSSTNAELNRRNNELSRQIDELNENIEKIKNSNKIKIDDLKIENDKLKKENDKFKEDIENLRIQSNELKKFKDKIENEKKNSEKYNPEVKYDIAVNIDNIRGLINGWKIQLGNEYKKNLTFYKNEKILKIGFLGYKNSGKSFILSKLLNENIYDNKETDYLYLRFIKEQKKILAFIDPPGLGRSMKKTDKSEIRENNNFDEEEKIINQTDNFLMNFIIKNNDFLIVVIGPLNIYEQKLILKLKNKDLEHKEAFSKLKRIYVIHNLKEFSKKEEINEHIKNVIFNSKTFNLEEKESQLTKKVKDNTKNTKYFIEEHENKEIEIYHLILAKDKTDAGNYYNEFTYNLIVSHFNYFFANNSFDLINEIKKEIISISDKIFIKPLKTLEDFENNSDLIKVKKEFTFIPKSDDNSDFSFIKLKPKYSYFKVEQNTKLLIVIEMPGIIINQKLSCSSPKNGYYSVTFSGKKVLNYPEIPEKDKKDGLYYNNREEGEFKEVFKIKQNDFILSSHKCIKEEKEDNGVYKYYFKLVSDESDED